MRVSRETVAFAERIAFYIVAFNHLTPFPGTPLYERFQTEGRLLYDPWWLDDRYSPTTLFALSTRAACPAEEIPPRLPAVGGTKALLLDPLDAAARLPTRLNRGEG